MVSSVSHAIGTGASSLSALLADAVAASCTRNGPVAATCCLLLRRVGLSQSRGDIRGEDTVEVIGDEAGTGIIDGAGPRIFRAGGNRFFDFLAGCW